jgi:PAS domain S-box-containing protein
MDEPRALRRARPHDFSAVRLLQRIAVVANEADTLSKAISVALDEVCAYTAWPIGHAYLVDPNDPHLLAPTRLWHLPDRRKFRALVQITGSTPLHVGRDLTGRVLKTGRPRWIHDVTRDANFSRAHGSRDVGVRGAFAVPILVGRNAIGVLEFFSEYPEPQDDVVLELVSYVGTQLGRVAEREQAALALVAQVEQTRRLIESAFDAFIAIDDLGRVTSWNQAAEAMFGWEADEVIGRPLVTRIVPLRYRQQHVSGIARYLATKESHLLNQRVELTALRRNGEEFPVEIAIWPVEAEGRTTFCGLVHDITERKVQEHEREVAADRIKTSEQRLMAAQEMAAVGSWEWEIDSDVVEWSDQLYRNFDLSPDEFQPSPEGYRELIHPEDRSYVEATITRALEERGTFEFEHRVIRPSDGAVRIHQCQGRTIVSSGGAVKMAGTSQDVTEHRRSEEALQEAYLREREMVRRLEELDKARTEFVSAVSHELRTPLTSIIGYLQLVLDMGHEITDEHLEMLDIVDRNSQRLLALIEDLLTKSRIESGTFKLNVAPTDLGKIVETSVQAVLPSAIDRDVALSVSIDPELPAIDADSGHIERLLLNLLSNAIKFTEGGEVTVGAHLEGEHVVITVRDTGVGIAEDELPKLFSPFFRTQTAEKTAPGTGLGLVLVKSIVEAHGGTIDVASKLGEGTTVTVRLPISQASADESAA